MKKVILINGNGGCGKDTFIRFFRNVVQEKIGYDSPVFNISSIDPFKEAASLLGWDGHKDDKGRKFLSDLKQVAIEYNDYPTQYCMKEIHYYTDMFDHCFIFVHIREPEEIKKLQKCLDTYEINHFSLLILKKEEKPWGNRSDGKVQDFDYNMLLSNNGSLEDLSIKAKYLLTKLME